MAKYISKGMVIRESTEDLLYVTRCGHDFQLTKAQAALWLNARFGFDTVNEEDPIARVAFQQLRRQELVELAENKTRVGEYRALTQCVVVPAQVRGFMAPLNMRERQTLKWISRAGLRLSTAELVFLNENKVRPDNSLLGYENRQTLTELLYTKETIFDNILEARMEQAEAMAQTIKTLLALLKKKRVILL